MSYPSPMTYSQLVLKKHKSVISRDEFRFAVIKLIKILLQVVYLILILLTLFAYQPQPSSITMTGAIKSAFLLFLWRYDNVKKSKFKKPTAETQLTAVSIITNHIMLQIQRRHDGRNISNRYKRRRSL